MTDAKIFKSVFVLIAIGLTYKLGEIVFSKK